MRERSTGNYGQERTCGRGRAGDDGQEKIRPEKIKMNKKKTERRRRAEEDG